MKYTFDNDNYIELSDNLSRKKMRALTTSFGIEFFDTFKSIVINLKMTNTDGEVVTDIEEFTEDFIDTCEYVLIEWSRTLPLVHINNIINKATELKKSLLSSTVIVAQKE